MKQLQLMLFLHHAAGQRPHDRVDMSKASTVRDAHAVSPLTGHPRDNSLFCSRAARHVLRALTKGLQAMYPAGTLLAGTLNKNNTTPDHVWYMPPYAAVLRPRPWSCPRSTRAMLVTYCRSALPVWKACPVGSNHNNQESRLSKVPGLRPRSLFSK